LSNGLKAAGIEAAMVIDILAQTEIDGMRRGETLSLAEFAAIANVWTSKQKKTGAT